MTKRRLKRIEEENVKKEANSDKREKDVHVKSQTGRRGGAGRRRRNGERRERERKQKKKKKKKNSVLDVQKFSRNEEEEKDGRGAVAQR